MLRGCLSDGEEHNRRQEQQAILVFIRASYALSRKPMSLASVTTITKGRDSPHRHFSATSTKRAT
jgi:hypothetical protein